MNETTLLSDRLHRLADDMTPTLDVVGQVRAAREGHRRQWRDRIALLAVATATAAAAVAVPLGIDALNASAPDGGVTGPGGSSNSAVPTPTGADEDLAQQRSELAEAHQRAQAQLERRAADVAALTAAFQARATPLSLTAPADRWSCPRDKGGAMSAVLSVGLDYAVSTVPGEGCAWKSGQESGNPADYFTLGVSFNAGWTEQDFRKGFYFNQDCEHTEMPASTPTAVLEVCAHEDTSQWLLYVPDSSGTGVWTLGADVGEHQPVDAPRALTAVLAVAEATW